MFSFHYTSTPISTPSIQRQYKEYINTIAIPKNTTSQHNAAEKINSAIKRLSEYEKMKEIATNDLVKIMLSIKLIEKQQIVSDQQI